MSSSRIFVSDMYDLRPDPADNRMIRMTNCLQLLSCVCDVAAIFDENLRHLAHLIHVTAEIVFYTIIGCMAAQVTVILFIASHSLPPFPTSLSNTLILSLIYRSTVKLMCERQIRPLTWQYPSYCTPKEREIP